MMAQKLWLKLWESKYGVVGVCVVGLLLWLGVFSQLDTWSRWAVYQGLGLPHANPTAHALQFFIYEVPKVLLLLTLVVWLMGLVRTFITPQKTRELLARKGGLWTYFLAALLGTVTPFCSCSAISIFLGFLSAGVPLGVTFAFLIAAPMVDQVALAMLWGMFSWKIALIYWVTGLVIAISVAWILGKMNLEDELEPWAKKENAGDSTGEHKPLRWKERAELAWKSTGDILNKVWLYVVLGVGVGAGIHGFVPQDFMAQLMGKTWWSVPVAVVLGVPMYSSVSGVIPILQALVEKGAALGTCLAFVMAVVALSLPEMIILRRVMKLKLLVKYVAIVTAGIIIVGYLFNALL